MKSTTAPATPSQKIYFLDHDKIVVTALVVMHHTFIVYGSPGSWPYRESIKIAAAVYPMTLFCNKLVL